MNETLQNNIKKLPLDVKAILQSDKKIETLFELARKHDLYESDIKPLINEVDLILLNLEDIELLNENLQRELEINPITASRLADDIDTQIFTPIKSSLQRIQQERREEETHVSEVLESQKPIIPTQPPQQPLNRIAEVKKVAPVLENLPTNLPMVEVPEERELVVQKNPPMQTSTPPLKGGVESSRGWSSPTVLPKTFGESAKPNITPTAKPVTPLNLRGEAEPPVKQVQVSPSPPKLGGVPSLSADKAGPRGGVISPDQFFVSRPKQPARSIVEAKLAGSFNMPQEKVNVSAPNPSGKKVDPYREPIE